MRTEIGRAAAAVMAIAGSLLTGGCAPRSCSAVLFLDGVVIHLDAPAQTADLIALRACVGSSCAEQPVVAGDRSDQSIPIAVGAGQVLVSVTGHDRAGRQVFAGSTAVTTVVSEQDGPGCQSVHLAKATITPAGLRPTA